MEISQFELVYKPQSPVGTADTVTQGYFLEISNLEDRNLFFALRLTTSAVNDPDRSLFGNAKVFVDTPGVDNNIGEFELRGPATSVSFGLNRRIFVPSKGTALVALLPSDPFPPDLVPPASANFECRGYASLTLPAVFSGPPFPTFAAQASEPQKILITAQNRAVYTDPSTGAAKGQTQSSLPLCNGQSCIEIEPESPFVFDGNPFELEAAARVLDAVDENFEDVLAGMLSAASASKMDLKKFNAALKKSGVGMAIETRKS